MIKQDVKVTDLDSEENKTGFNEKNQYGLNWTLPQAKSLYDECTVNPAISYQGEPLDPVNPPTETYHNLYPIIIVVTAFVATESRTAASDRELFIFEKN